MDTEAHTDRIGSMSNEESVTVIIYCTLCGNRSVRNAVTGQLREARIRMPRAMIDEVRKGVCIHCRSPLDARIVHEPRNESAS